MSKEYGYSNDGKIYRGRYVSRGVAIAYGHLDALRRAPTHTGVRVRDSELVGLIIVDPASVEPVITPDMVVEVTDKEIDRLQKMVMGLERDVLEHKAATARLLKQLEDAPTEPAAKIKKKPSKQG